MLQGPILTLTPMDRDRTRLDALCCKQQTVFTMHAAAVAAAGAAHQYIMLMQSLQHIATIFLYSYQVESLSTAADDDANNPQGTEIVLDVGRGTLTLVGPSLPQLAQLLGRPMPPWQLMSACEECGLRLTPGGAEAKVAGLQEKDQVLEGAMCADLALLW